MPERIACIVPFCRRTIAAEKMAHNREWICGKHWRHVSAQRKASYRRAVKRVRKIIARKPIYLEYWLLPPGSPARCAAVNMWRRIDGIWDRCKAEAIEAAGGIA